MVAPECTELNLSTSCQLAYATRVSFALTFVGLLFAGVLLFVAAFAVRSRRDIRPDLAVAGDALVAYESTAFHALAAAGAACETAAYLYNFLVLVTSARADPASPAAAFVCAVLALGFGAAAVIFAVSAIKPPAVVVRADGVVIRTARRATLVPWAVVVADHDSLYAAGLRGITTSDESPRWPQLTTVVDLRRLDVPPRRVVDVIVHYRDTPADRAAIGVGAVLPAAPTPDLADWAAAAWESTAWDDGRRAADK
jgi:hypothetical protein